MDILRDYKFAQTLHIVCDVDKEYEEALHNIQNAFAVQNAVPRLLRGDISPSEYLEIVESSIVPMDNYIDEICNNIEIFLSNENQ
jgi:hypothetical protein